MFASHPRRSGRRIIKKGEQGELEEEEQTRAGGNTFAFDGLSSGAGAAAVRQAAVSVGRCCCHGAVYGSAGLPPTLPLETGNGVLSSSEVELAACWIIYT